MASGFPTPKVRCKLCGKEFVMGFVWGVCLKAERPDYRHVEETVLA